MRLTARLRAVIAANTKRFVDQKKIGRLFSTRFLNEHHRATPVLTTRRLDNEFLFLTLEILTNLAFAFDERTDDVQGESHSFTINACARRRRPHSPWMQNRDLSNRCTRPNRIDLFFDPFMAAKNLGRSAPDEMKPIGLLPFH